ncbi:hypothetical protein LBHL_21810 [Lactobacillus helveticus]|uniref:hypothetical protein n=1 Tax=Lactobacillus helveticus TaxID=1587 RepID=UPI001BB50991|nr:hypothetical protein [Lactobacillus helveticus]BCD39624.1 hypothetical protein LBHL_21810 [Lactobacillus helveticus]
MDFYFLQSVQVNFTIGGDFLIGLLTNIANNKKLPFSKLTNEEEEKAILAAKLSALTTSWGNIPELKNLQQLKEWLNEEKND